MSEHTFDPPTHEDDVRRGLGVAITSGEAGEMVDVNLGQDASPVARDSAVEKLAVALAAEFQTLFGGAEIQGAASAWLIAARGVLDKMQADCTSGEGGVVIVTLP